MRSSISSSKAARWLIAGCALVALAAEGAARLALDRVSKIQRRTTEEYRLAQAIGSDRCGRQHVLVVGNSLLDEDVRFDRVRDAFAGQWDARRFVIEQTFYYDWYYGLKRLFHEGARPDLVIIMLSARQWVRTETRGDYSAHHLMTARDLPAVARDLHLNATQTTNLFFARASKFWGARAEIRNFLLGRALPDLGQLMNASSQTDGQKLNVDEVQRVAGERIGRLRALTAAHGARLVVLIPVMLGSREGQSWVGLTNAARTNGVTSLMPAAAGSFAPNMYRDAGFHLNPKGASAFTDVLIPALQKELTEASP